MTTEIVPSRTVALPTVYDRAANVADFLVNVGRAIHSSGMFGCDSPSQGYVLALECAARKMPPLTLAERYHLIKGKLSMKAEAMLADFAKEGSHEIIERSPTRAAIKLVRNRKSHVFELTWEDAVREPFVYEGKEADVIAKLAAGKTGDLKLKPKYATPRARTQMLWARVVSDGVRAMAPEVVAGHYAPEEVADFADVDLGSLPAEPVGEEDASDDPQPAPPPAADAEQAEIDRLKAKADADLAAAKAAEEKLLREAPPEAQPATFAAKSATPKPAPAQPPGPDSAGPAAATATPDQVARVKMLVTELEVSRDRLAAMLGRVGAAKVSDLSVAHCNALIDAMEREKAKRRGN